MEWNKITTREWHKWHTAVRRHCTDWYETWALTDHEIYYIKIELDLRILFHSRCRNLGWPQLQLWPRSRLLQRTSALRWRRRWKGNLGHQRLKRRLQNVGLLKCHQNGVPGWMSFYCLSSGNSVCIWRNPMHWQWNKYHRLSTRSNSGKPLWK